MISIPSLAGDETLLEARESINKAIEEHTKSDGVISNRAAVTTTTATTTTVDGATGTGKLANSTSIGIGSTLPTHHPSVGGMPGSLKKSRSRHYIVGTSQLPVSCPPPSSEVEYHLQLTTPPTATTFARHLKTSPARLHLFCVRLPS